MPQKGDHTHLVNFLRLRSMYLVEGWRVLQEGFRRSSAQNRSLGGDVRLKSGGHLLLFLLIRGAPRGLWSFLSAFSNKAPFGLPPIG